MERRFITAEFRAVDDEKLIIEGYPIVYEKETDLGYCREKIACGAATEALKISDEFVLFNHDSNIPLARRANNTLEVKEDEKGVWIRADLSKSSAGPDVYADIKNGLITKMSFAFTCLEDAWNSEENLRTITKFKELYDYSPVTYPAYRQTELVARSADEALRNKPAAGEPNREEPAGEVRGDSETQKAESVKNSDYLEVL